jgi:hypothetical protein
MSVKSWTEQVSLPTYGIGKPGQAAPTGILIIKARPMTVKVVIPEASVAAVVIPYRGVKKLLPEI